MSISVDFMEQLDTGVLEANGAYIADSRKSGGYVSQQIIKAESKADYIMAYNFRNNLSDIVYSTK